MLYTNLMLCVSKIYVCEHFSHFSTDTETAISYPTLVG